MADDPYIEVALEDFSDSGLGRAIVEFAEDGDIGELLEEARRRSIERPDVVVREEAKFFEFIAWLCSKTPSA